MTRNVSNLKVCSLLDYFIVVKKNKRAWEKYTLSINNLVVV